MLVREIAKLELTGDHIGIMINIEITKLEFSGGHFGIMLIQKLPNWN